MTHRGEQPDRDEAALAELEHRPARDPEQRDRPTAPLSYGDVAGGLADRNRRPRPVPYVEDPTP